MSSPTRSCKPSQCGCREDKEISPGDTNNRVTLIRLFSELFTLHLYLEGQCKTNHSYPCKNQISFLPQMKPFMLSSKIFTKSAPSSLHVALASSQDFLTLYRLTQVPLLLSIHPEGQGAGRLKDRNMQSLNCTLDTASQLQKMEYTSDIMKTLSGHILVYFYILGYET